MPDNDLIDCIYEAALVPETWPNVLSRVASEGTHFGGVLYAVTPNIDTFGRVTLSPIPRWVACEQVAPYVEMFIRDGWLSHNLRAERAVAASHHGFLTDDDLCTVEEIRDAPLYQYLKQHGMGWHCGMTVKVPTGDVLVFNFERRWIDGPASPEEVERLNGIKGHLARAALFASRLGLDRARSGVEALGIVGLPAAFLSAQGSCMVANDHFDSLRSDVFVDGTRGRLRLKNHRADALFQSALGTTLKSYSVTPGGGEIMSVPIPATASNATMIVHLLPIRRAARDVFTNATCALLVTALDAKVAPSAQVLRGLFDLTNAEAEIARSIAAGQSIQDIARTDRKAPGTVRQQLKSVFEKTGVKRQAELVHLLAGTGFDDTVSKLTES